MENERLTNSRKRRLSDDDLINSPSKKVKDSLNMKRTQKSRQIKSKFASDESLSNVFTTNDYLLFPFTYKNLLDMFISLDLVVNKLINSKDHLYIDKISQLMRQMNKNDFNIDVFGQILFVFPESYQYQCEQSPSKATRHHISRIQVLPNIRFVPNDSSPRKSEKSLSLSQLIIRRNTFRERLLALVKEKHDVFLLNVKKMKMEDIKEMKIVRWCSDFDLSTVEKVPSKILDKNNLFRAESVVKSSATAVSVKESEVCKDLFGASDTKKEISSESNTNERTSTPNRSFANELRPKSTARQSQLSFVDDKRPVKFRTPIKKDGDILPKQKLPFHLKALLEFFVIFDKTVHSLYSRGELAYLSRVLKNASMVKTYTESHFGQLVTVYPDCYKLRWERVLNKVTSRATNKMDVVVTPHLRHDGTNVAITSPAKGFIKFDCVRLKQRSDRFLELCAEIVERFRKSYAARDKPQEGFNAELHVDIITPAPLPQKTFSKDSEEGNRIKSIADMFSVIKRRNEQETKSCVKTEAVGEKISSIPQALLDRVRQNKLDRHLFPKNEVAVRRRLLLERLPKLAMTLRMELGKRAGQEPMARSSLLGLVHGATGISEGDFDEAIALLNEVAPDCARLVNWDLPSLQLGTSQASVLDIQNKVAILLRG